MNPTLIKGIGLAAAAVCIFSAGWVSSTHWNAPKQVAITPHPEVVQHDGSHIAARAPVASPQPVMELPRRAVVDSTARIVLKARRPVSEDKKPIPADCIHLVCPAVTIDLASIHSKSGPDLAIKTEGADIDSSVFHPRNTFDVPKEHRNMLGVTYSTGQRYGVIFERMSGPVVLGVMAGQGADGKPEAGVMAGWRW